MTMLLFESLDKQSKTKLNAKKIDIWQAIKTYLDVAFEKHVISLQNDFALYTWSHRQVHLRTVCRSNP